VLASPHKIRFTEPLRNVRVHTGAETFVSETRFRQSLEERYRSGYEEGQKALAEQLVEQRRQLVEIQNGLLRSIQSSLPSVVADCEKSIVLLAMESARKVVEALPITAEMIEAVVKKALTELQDTAEYEVLLHPEDLAMLQQVSSGLLPSGDNVKVRFGIDSRVTRGGCIIKTHHGAITALRERMFEKLEAAVLG
jgi:flagellar biosynthesis/type III secretory pathway protein FliH